MNSVPHLVLVLDFNWQKSKMIAQKSGAFFHLEATKVLFFQQTDGKVFLFLWWSMCGSGESARPC